MKIRDILKLLNKSMPDASIGSEIGLSQATVCRLRNGKHKTTSHEHGIAIHDLARRRGIEINEKSSK